MRYNIDRRCTELQNYTNLVSNMQVSKKNVMVLLGDDFMCSNQYACFQQIDSIVKNCNNIQKSNMTFMYSTPSRYV